MQRPLPAELLAIPPNKLDIGSAIVSSDIRYTGSVDPAELIKNQPDKYSCADIKLISRRFDDKQEPALPTESIFVGSHVDLGDLCYKQLLHSEAIKYGLNPNAFFLPATPKPAGEMLLESLPEGNCGVHVSYAYAGAINEQKVTVAGPLPDGQTPPECQIEGAICRRELVGFSGGAGASNTANLPLAYQVAMEAIQTALPTAVRCQMFDGNCKSLGAGGPNCTDVCLKVEKTGDKTTYTMYALSNVPSVAGIGTTVSAVASESGELGYAR